MNEIRNSTLFDTFCHTQNIRGMVDWNTCPTTTTPKLVNVFHIEFLSLLWFLISYYGFWYLCLYGFQYTYCVEVVPICKDNLICLPARVAHGLGGIGQVCIVHKVTSLIHLIDPNTCQGNNVFWLVKCNRGVETRLWRILNHISSFYMLCFSAFSHKICAGAL